MSINRTIHLYNRFGFGLTGAELKRFKETGLREKLAVERRSLIDVPIDELLLKKPKEINKEMRKTLRKARRSKLEKVKTDWLDRMMHSENFAHEKIVLFWHHHFACKTGIPTYAAQFSNAIRRNATSNFGTLVKDISQSAAMMGYLNVRRSVKGKPNEDFARELCELFMLGRDKGYTEPDIQEIARCFTGWKHKVDGTYFLAENKHDNGEKTIFGKTGNFNGIDVIDLILEKRECADFIAANIYEFFVDPEPNQQHIEELANVLYEGGYELEPVFLHIAESEWFYAPEHVMCKIKSPLELIIGIARQLDVKANRTQAWGFLLRSFGQELYKPRNVKGWSVDREWIDSNSLTKRLKLASQLLAAGQLDLAAQPDYDSDPNEGKNKRDLERKVGFSYNWKNFLANNHEADLKQLYFNGKLTDQAKRFLADQSFDSRKEEVVQLMSLPEYQLC